MKKILEHLKKLQEARDSQNNVVTETTDIKKINLPNQVANKLQEPTFVSKVKGKK
jgi:hypothetical protein